MSGICGVMRLNGAECAPDELAGMLQHLAPRGPDGSAVWAEGAAALGHALLATTPEALEEQLPFRHAPSGCVITGDIRIDNRDELLAALGIAGGGRVIGDGELVLRAYLRWSTACLAHLLGDFAFAIWDAPSQHLFCARDQVGMRQLIYHHAPGQIFAFATDADAVAGHPAIPRRINEARIGDFLEDLEACDLTSTFYQGIYRLPPAHALIVEGDVLRIWRYWELPPPSPLRLADDRAYADAFLEVFTEAVRSRLRAPAGKLGSMLSGGMDSGSVVAVAARLLYQAGEPALPTFSATGSAQGCTETRTIRAAQTMAHLAPRDIAIEDFAAHADQLTRLSQQSGEPFDGDMAMLRAVYLGAQQQGVSVMFDGVAGDTTLMADDMVAWRLRRGDIIGGWREATGARRFWGPEMPTVLTFINGARHVLVPEGLRALRRRAGAESRQRRADQASMVAPALARSINMAERRAAHARHVALKLDGRCDDRRALVMHPYVVVARERYDRVAAQFGIEPRDPFLDRRLLDFVLALPADQIEHDGWPKIILRRAMAGLLPDAVRWRVGKEHVGWLFDDAVVAHWLGGAKPGWHNELHPFVRSARLTAIDAARHGRLAVATQKTLSYPFWWMSRFRDR
ncbi:MAG: asparagine synthase-related protein [Erythrobacter sp.]|nr:asparagine synthase-related protein [Erythrobacter sp.]